MAARAAWSPAAAASSRARSRAPCEVRGDKPTRVTMAAARSRWPAPMSTMRGAWYPGDDRSAGARQRRRVPRTAAGSVSRTPRGVRVTRRRRRIPGDRAPRGRPAPAGVRPRESVGPGSMRKTVAQGAARAWDGDVRGGPSCYARGRHASGPDHRTGPTCDPAQDRLVEHGSSRLPESHAGDAELHERPQMIDRWRRVRSRGIVRSLISGMLRRLGPRRSSRLFAWIGMAGPRRWRDDMSVRSGLSQQMLRLLRMTLPGHARPSTVSPKRIPAARQCSSAGCPCSPPTVRCWSHSA